MDGRFVIVILVSFLIGLSMQTVVFGGPADYASIMGRIKAVSLFLSIISTITVLLIANIYKRRPTRKDNIDALYEDIRMIIINTIIILALPSTPSGYTIGMALLLITAIPIIDITARAIYSLDGDTRR